MVSKKSGTTRKKKGTKKTTKKGYSAKRANSKSAAPPLMHDRRAMEKTMLQMRKLLDEQEFETIEEANVFLQQFVGVKDIPQSSTPLTSLDQAQEKMYEAWEASGKRRVKLAHEALEISPDCADAYVLLAEETTRTPEEARVLYEQGVKAGERALGKEIFEDAAGEFWGILETRPYMRARAGLAEVLAAIDEKQQAIEHYRELLRLNPNDNQGNRYLLTHLLLQEGMDKELGELLTEYEEDASAEWVYTRSLWLFRREGASEDAADALRAAFARNPHVPLYLTGGKRLPSRPPEYIGRGDENEAVAYIFEAIEDWVMTPGAPEWLAETMLEALQQMKDDEGEEMER